MATRYPIILVHGIALKDVSFFRAFGNLTDILRADGQNVYSCGTDGFATVENNALHLKQEILDILAETDAEKINIIAHSKGGLDSKHMIKELGMEDRVASLTTVCTPHKGSPVATFLWGFPMWMKRIISFGINTLYRVLGDKQPDALTVCTQLALKDDAENNEGRFSEKIYCQSFSSNMHRSRDDFLMGIPLFISKHHGDKDSDGMVSAESAAWENYRGRCVEMSVSHSEIVDLLPKKRNRKAIHDFYIDLCRELETMGF